MKGFLCQHLKLYLFFVLFSFLSGFLVLVLLAPTANAYELTTEVKATGRSWKAEGSDVRCTGRVNGVVSTTNQSICKSYNNNKGTGTLLGVYLKDKVDVKEGYYYRFLIGIQGIQSLSSGTVKGVLWYPSAPDGFTLISSNQISWNELERSTNVQGTVPAYSYIYDVSLMATDSGDYYIGLGNGTSTLVIIPNGSLDYSSNVSIVQVFEYSPSDTASELNNQQQQAGEQAQSDGQSAGDSSGSEAESKGTTLLGAFTSFVGAVTSATPSNCVINADIGDFRMGDVNLCSLTVPPAVRTISSIILVAFCVPLSIAVSKKMISLFRSFQNG